MTDFCGIPLVSLRENSITELDLNGKGIGVPGAIVLSKLLPSAAALTSLKCATAPSRVCQAPMNTSDMPPPRPRWQARRQRHRREGRQGDCRRAQGLSAVYAEVHPRTLPARNVTTLQIPEVFSPQ